MKMYRFIFLDGTIKQNQGRSCSQAFCSLGYTLGEINKLKETIVLEVKG